MEEYVPLPGWWYVGTLMLNRHRFFRSINRSTVRPLSSSFVDPHISLWALKSPIMRKGDGNWLTRATR